MIFRAPRRQPPIMRDAAAHVFGGVDYPDWALPSFGEFIARSGDPNPWPEVTGNTAGFYSPVNEGFLRLQELVVGRFPNSVALGIPTAGGARPTIRRMLFPALPPGG